MNTERPNVKEDSLSVQIEERRAKLALLKQNNQAYPNNFQPNTTADTLKDKYDNDQYGNEELEKVTDTFKIAGRMLLKRVMGKASFMQVQDSSGKMQIYLQRDVLDDKYQAFKTWDLGDIVAITGRLFRTKTNELTIKASDIQLLTKSLRPLPDKFHGLADIDIRYRQRYLDLIVNPEVRNIFVTRGKIINFIRNYLVKRKFLEVETPMMHPIPGGATARPFKTYHNTFNIDLYLRIAPELYLKRLLVGGFDRVFEINRNFRNEGISTRHNPEFTMLEFYQSYATYNDFIPLTEDLLRTMSLELFGSTTITYQGHKLDFGKSFTRLTMLDAILKYNPSVTKEQLLDLEKIRQLASELKALVKPEYGIGKIQNEIFEKTVEENLIEPTFITEYPTEISPLARPNDNNAEITDRFELFIAGREIANAFSELNDPDKQAAAFSAQAKAKTTGDVEAMFYDDDYIKALEYGMPPAAGEGIGIDRLVMLFTDMPSIRDVLLFPQLRPNNAN
ncbi:MAG: lysine--tRNA ligase [Legionellales bacterium]|nr:MAG: lysine--tRNA ligase [Legionellales bacterium]